MELDDDEVESLWFIINPHRSKRPILVGAIYRPPGSAEDTDDTIKTVTRPISATCLDHVYTTNLSFIVEISVPNIGLADPLHIFFRCKYGKQLKQNTSHTIKYRDLKNLNSNILKRDLLDAP